jgi:hypothetical protein
MYGPVSHIAGVGVTYVRERILKLLQVKNPLRPEQWLEFKTPASLKG